MRADMTAYKRAAAHYRDVYAQKVAPSKVGMKHTAETAADTRAVFEAMSPYRKEASTKVLEDEPDHD